MFQIKLLNSFHGTEARLQVAMDEFNHLIIGNKAITAAAKQLCPVTGSTQMECKCRILTDMDKLPIGGDEFYVLFRTIQNGGIFDVGLPALAFDRTDKNGG